MCYACKEDPFLGNLLRHPKLAPKRARVIAFAGVSCTGKSTMVREIAQSLVAKDHTVLVLPEIARQYMHYTDKPTFQAAIASEETCRLSTIMKMRNSVDYIIVDRTCYDQLAYLEYDRQMGTVHSINPIVNHVYDCVFFFGEPHKNPKQLQLPFGADQIIPATLYHDADIIRMLLLKKLQPVKDVLHIMGNSETNREDIHTVMENLAWEYV